MIIKPICLLNEISAMAISALLIFTIILMKWASEVLSVFISPRSMAFCLPSMVILLTTAVFAKEAAPQVIGDGFSLNQSITPLSTATMPIKRFRQLEWRSQFFALEAGSATSDLTSIGLKLNMNIEYEFDKTFSFIVEPEMSFSSGHQLGFLKEKSTNETGIYLRDGYARFQPFRQLHFRFGVLRQDLFNNPLFLRTSPFPGMRQSFSLSFAKLTTSMHFQQLIPTSTTLSTKAVEKEDAPQLQTQTFTASYQSNPWSFALTGSLFQFKDLPSTVAADGHLNGNSIRSNNALNPSFRYGYSGYTASAQMKWSHGERLQVALISSFLTNQSAPNDRNKGLWNELMFRHPVGHKYSFAYDISYFVNQKDSSPSYYNEWWTGHNNRQGLRLQSSVKNHLLGIELAATYIEHKPIQKESLFFAEKIFGLYLRTDYESL